MCVCVCVCVCVCARGCVICMCIVCCFGALFIKMYGVCILCMHVCSRVHVLYVSCVCLCDIYDFLAVLFLMPPLPRVCFHPLYVGRHWRDS